MKRILIGFIFIAICSSQDVKVFKLSPETTSRASKAYANLTAATDAWEAEKTQLNKEHPEGGGYVVFSDDFTVGVIPPGKLVDPAPPIVPPGMVL